MDSLAKEILSKRKDRAIATILGTKDDYCDEYLPEDVSKRLRKEILDQLNQFYDVCLDLINAVDGNEFVLNELYFQEMQKKIDDIYNVITEEEYY